MSKQAVQLASKRAAGVPPRAAYANVLARLKARGGFELTGRSGDAKRWGIDHIVDYLEAAGRPDERFTVHVAGSKGKGSTGTIVEAILRESGAHTLLETSPDLHEARERLAIDGRLPSYELFSMLGERILADPKSGGWSYFELLTVMGWLAAREAGCDWQVLEVGLGGRLDTTNAVRSKQVAVVTPIDLEHTAILGDTIEQIAAEKAGIITQPCDVVLSPMEPRAREVIRVAGLRAGARVHPVEEVCDAEIRSHSLEGLRIDLETPVRRYRDLHVPLIGAHQAQNCATAVLAAEFAWMSVHGKAPGEESVRRGLRAVELPGRFEVAGHTPLVILDALHTLLSARRFREALESIDLPQSVAWVVGMLKDKAAEQIVEVLSDHGGQFFVAPPATPRAAAAHGIAQLFRKRGAAAHERASIASAIDAAVEEAGQAGAVLVVGGLRTIAEARRHLFSPASDFSLELE